MTRRLPVLCLAAAICAGATHAAGTPPTTRTLHTLLGLDVPIPSVTHAAAHTAPGYVFVAEKAPQKTGGPLIVDNRGRVVWFDQLTPPVQATDFRVQRYHGKPVLTWWVGRSNGAGVGRGSYVIYDDSYRLIARVRASRGLAGDLHEFQLTPRGTAYMTVYHEVPADLSSVGGPRHGYVYDSIVEEIDVATGRVVFEWHSLDHVPLSESTEANRKPARDASKQHPLDYFHVNSIADGPGGTILISGRNTSTIYLLARRDGHIIWRLGGRHSDFGPPAAVKFAFQHNARLHRGGVLTLFDNGGIPRVEPFSRPLELRLDLATKQRDDREDLSPAEEDRFAVRGQPAAAAGRRRPGRLGRRADRQRVRARRQLALPAEAALRRQLPRLPQHLDRASRGASPGGRRCRCGLRQLER